MSDNMAHNISDNMSVRLNVSDYVRNICHTDRGWIIMIPIENDPGAGPWKRGVSAFAGRCAVSSTVPGPSVEFHEEHIWGLELKWAWGTRFSDPVGQWLDLKFMGFSWLSHVFSFFTQNHVVQLSWGWVGVMIGGSEINLGSGHLNMIHLHHQNWNGLRW